MGFLKKIFRGSNKKKKDDSGEGEPIADTSFPSSRQSKPSHLGVNPSASSSTNGTSSLPYQTNPMYNYNYNLENDRSNPLSPHSSVVSDLRSPRSSTGPVDTDDEGIIEVKDVEDVDAYYQQVRNQTQEELRLAYEKSRSPKNSVGNSLSTSLSGDFEDSLSSSASPRLTSNKLQQWTQQQHDSHYSSSSSSPPHHQSSAKIVSKQPIYSMASGLPMQMDNDNDESSASSFNLSTDAEDSEYESLKRTTMRNNIYYPQGNLNQPGPHSVLSALDTSAIDTVGSVTSYTTDEDRKIFPNLPTDDDMTLGTEASSKRGNEPPSLLLEMPLPKPLHSSQMTVAVPTPMASATDPTWKDNYEFSPSVAMPGATQSISRNKPGGKPVDFTSPRSNVSSSSPGKDKLNLSGNTMGSLHRSRDSAGGSTSSDHANKSRDSIEGRNEDVPKKIATKNRNSSKDAKRSSTLPDSAFADFENFADFSNFGGENPTPGAVEWPTVEEKKDQTKWETGVSGYRSSPTKTTSPNASSKAENTSNDGDDDNAWNIDIHRSPMAQDKSGTSSGKEDPFRAASYISAESSSTGFLSQDRSLTELLEAAKSKRKDRNSIGNSSLASNSGRNYGRHSSRLSTSSVNSAPAITSSYLRQHHNLSGSASNSAGLDGTASDRYNGDKSFSPNGADGTSVSDIIQSLEATDRMKRDAQNPYGSHRSMGDAGVVATARAAKERLKERRRRERELNGTSFGTTPKQNSDSDDSEHNHEASESWLFDQVTGAMGPVGIAADLESLSGRSNRSKNSHGGKSSATNSRRRSSRRSRSRVHRSDKSVDSHGSRASRYSHRSTKSFLSQMSEQSRSVANDLLRLEMQLAMVGNNNGSGASTSNSAIDSLPVVQSARAERAMSSSASLASRNSSRSSRNKYSSTNGSSNSHSHSSSSVVRRTKTTILAPPGKLGIILANKADSKGTVVSGVRTSSVLVHQISPGDRIVAIDGEDVSRMTVSEITTIMSRKAEYERRLTVLTIPHTPAAAAATSPRTSRSSQRATPEFSSTGYRR